MVYYQVLKIAYRLLGKLIKQYVINFSGRF